MFGHSVAAAACFDWPGPGRQMNGGWDVVWLASSRKYPSPYYDDDGSGHQGLLCLMDEKAQSMGTECSTRKGKSECRNSMTCRGRKYFGQ